MIIQVNRILVLEKFHHVSTLQPHVRVDTSYIGVSMFNPTREHDTNPTRVFSV